MTRIPPQPPPGSTERFGVVVPDELPLRARRTPEVLPAAVATLALGTASVATGSLPLGVVALACAALGGARLWRR